ncbi:MAG: integrase family protein [Proteobacteria bacterium]|nr:integrase family protein [Pseudomonadota bacterium]
MRILPALADPIAMRATGAKTLLLSGWGNPFAMKGVGNWFRDRCDEAGIPASANGLRKAAATRCTESGTPASKLVAMFGWTPLQEAERYVAEGTRLGPKGSESLKDSH